MKPKDNTPPGWRGEPPEFFYDAVQAALEPFLEECESSEDVGVRAFPVVLWTEAERIVLDGAELPAGLTREVAFLRILVAVAEALEAAEAKGSKEHTFAVWTRWKRKAPQPPFPPVPTEAQLESIREAWKARVKEADESGNEGLGQRHEIPFPTLPPRPPDTRKVAEILKEVGKSTEEALYTAKSRERERMRLTQVRQSLKSPA